MIQFSKAAVQEINRLRAKNPNPQAIFRVGIQPGGCADLYYTLSFDEAVNADDKVFEHDTVQFVVSSAYEDYLKDLKLDYSEDLMGGGFRFHNPNALQSCGCGNSFSIENLPS